MKLGTYLSMSDKLQGEYKQTFDYAEGYCDSHMISGSYKNERMMDLLDMLMEAQGRESGVSSVVGKDIEAFCKDYFSDVPLASMVVETFSGLKFWAWFVVVFEALMILSVISEPDFNIFTLKTDMSSYAQGFLIAYLGVFTANVISLILAIFHYYNPKLNIGMTIVFTLATIGGCIYMAEKDIAWSVPVLPVIIVAASYLIVYYIVRNIYRYKKTGTIRKMPNEYDTTFAGLVKLEIEAQDWSATPEYMKVYATRYKNANEKRRKKNQPMLTTKEFLEHNAKLSENALIYGVGIGITLATIGSFLSESGFDTIMDMLIFLLLMGVIFFGTYRLNKKISKTAKKENAKILALCEKYNMEVDALYEHLKEQKEINQVR